MIHEFDPGPPADQNPMVSPTVNEELRESALAKLVALGLTPEEAVAIAGG